MRVELISANKPSPQVAFGLLPQPSALPVTQVIGGSPGGLAELSLLMEQLAAARIAIRPMIPAESLPLLPTSMPTLALPALMQASQDTDVSIVGAGLKLSSQIQILLDGWMSQDQALIIALDEIVPLIKTRPSLLDQSHVAWLVSMPQLVRLAVATDRRAQLNHQESIHNVARLMEAQAPVGPWLTAYTSDRVYLWLPVQQLCLHAPVPAGMTLSALRAALMMIICITVLRRRTHLAIEDGWRVALWMVQQLKTGGSARDQFLAIEQALEAAANS